MTNKKLIRALLEAKFPGIDLEALTEIVMATPNPDLATEVLCGLYEPEVINEFISDKYKEDYKSKTNFVFNTYNKYKDELSYYYQEFESFNYWVKSGEEIPTMEEATNEYFKQYEVMDAIKAVPTLTREEFLANYSRRVIYGNVKPRIYESTMKLNQWNGVR